ncbi:MAG TPA: hypothetical protein VGX70_06910, partial [Gemmataceae bacterium]|nr:hypothetical protein [Gemmataceae bacterium]
GGGTFTGYPGFKGYTQGPGYWGKTFFIWPPDPNPANDWRKKFFFKSDGVTPCNDDTALFGNDTNGNNNAVDPITGNPVNPICLPQNGRWVVNYAAILNWIQNTGTNPFPAQLRAGRILYYSSIPSTIPNLPYDQITNQDQRFWKEYIDFALGIWQDPYGNVRYPGTPPMSYGPDFVWGNVKITGPDNNTKTSSFGTWIDPMENPPRPRHRFWFGPMTMIQYMLDTGLLPGNSHDISMFPAKIGISGALNDIQNNHPNDMVSMVLFNHPLYTSEYGGGPTPPEAGAFPQAQFSSSRNFTAMINALWFPPNSSVSDVRPWDTNGLQTPRAHGDYNANTATSYGFMLAYNQFSGAASLRTGGNGGLGRTGAQKLVILETDGMYNIHSTPVNGFSNNGVNQSFYRILPGDPINASGADYNALYQIVQAICNDNKGNAGNLPGYSPNPKYPGYSTPTAPVTVHCLVFGTIFEPSAPSGPGTIQTATVQMVQTISQIGGTVFPSSSTDPVNGYKWVIGDLTTRETKMRQAFDKIVDQGIPVSLIR